MDKRAGRLQFLIAKSGYKYSDLETLTGIPRSTIQRYASGKTTKIPMTAIESLAKALDVSPGYIMGWAGKEEAASDIRDGLTPAQRYFLDNVDRLTADQQELLAAQIKVLLDRQK